MKDTLKQYVALRSGLVAEKSALEARLREINRALGESTPAPAAAPRGRPPVAKAKGKGRGRGRSTTGGSLREAAVAALQGGKSLSRQDLLKAVVDSGYKFAAKDPLNSLSTLIYSNKKVFKAKSGLISLV